MKKIIVIALTVLFLVFMTIVADRATRRQVAQLQPANASTSGQPAPPLAFKSIDDKNVALADLKGKVIFVNFWATWCDPCRIEIPELIELQNKYSDKGFTVVGIAMDEDGKISVAPFVANERFDVNGQKLPMNYPILLGTDAAADKFGGILGYPTSFLISRDGRVVQKIQGLKSMDDLEKMIQAQL